VFKGQTRKVFEGNLRLREPPFFLTVGIKRDPCLGIEVLVFSLKREKRQTATKAD
jgi:hypothetical protein